MLTASLSAALHRKCQVADDDSTTTRLRLGFSSIVLLWLAAVTRGKTNWNANLKDVVYARGRWSATSIYFLPLNQNFVCIFINIHLRERGKERQRKIYQIDCYYDDCYIGKLRGFASITGSLGNLHAYEANKFLFVVLFLSQYLEHYICAADIPSKAFK